MTEHLDADFPAGRTADDFAVDGFPDGPHLFQAQLARQHDHVGELAVEAQALYVGNTELRGNVHLQAQAAGFVDGGHVGTDDGAHAGFPGGEQGLAHRRKVFIVEGVVESQVGPHAVFTAYPAYLFQVVRRKIVGGARAHVQLPDTEVNGIRTALDGSLQAREIACRSHYLQFIFHGG